MKLLTLLIKMFPVTPAYLHLLKISVGCQKDSINSIVLIVTVTMSLYKDNNIEIDGN